MNIVDMLFLCFMFGGMVYMVVGVDYELSEKVWVVIKVNDVIKMVKFV